MATTKIRLRSPYDPDRCVARIERHAEADSGTRVGVVGKAQDGRLALGIRRPAVNSFVPLLTARLTSDRGGTLITGRIGMPRSAITFMIFWFGFLGFFMLFAWGLLNIGGNTDFWFALPFYVVPVVMMAAGAWMVSAGRRMGEGDREALLGFLEEAIDARPDRPRYTVH